MSSLSSLALRSEENKNSSFEYYDLMFILRDDNRLDLKLITLGVINFTFSYLLDVLVQKAEANRFLCLQRLR